MLLELENMSNNSVFNQKTEINIINDINIDKDIYLVNIDDSFNKQLTFEQRTENILKFIKSKNIYRQISGTNLYVNDLIDYTDMYHQCLICGGFVVLGNVTKTLPEGAICPDACGAEVSILDDDAIYYSYDQAFASWEKYGDRQPEIITSNPAVDVGEVSYPIDVDDKLPESNEIHYTASFDNIG